MPRGRPKKNGGDVLLQSAELIGWALGGLEREIVATRQRLASLTSEATKLRASLGRHASPRVSAATNPAAVAGRCIIATNRLANHSEITMMSL